MRKGIDDDHLTYVEAGLIAQEAGVAAVALHARTAAQRYSGTADWDAIATLKQALDVPVLGNGDIWEADDALRMVEHTGVDGVVVGRGCLGRPWLFADLEAAFAGRPDRRRCPRWARWRRSCRRHAELLVDALERRAARLRRLPQARRLVPEGLPGRRRPAPRRWPWSRSLAELDDLLGKLDHAEPFPRESLGQPRGRINAPGKVSLPYGWLDSRDDDTVPEGAEMENSGG